MHYWALLQTLGVNLFDTLFQHGITIVPEWLSLTHGDPAPSMELIPQVNLQPSSVEALIPGDWVYFVNYPDYPQLHKTGAFTGENALYMGSGRFQGFGVEEQSYNSLVDYLRKQYNKDLLEKKQKKAPEESTKTIGGQVPGIEKGSVRRVAANETVRRLLGD